MDGVLRRRGTILERLLHYQEQPVRVRVTQLSSGRVLFGALACTRTAAEHGIQRMRFALGVDEQLADFHQRFARDQLIGASVRARPWLRVPRRPDPFEALAWAVCEQLIEFERAAAIERRLVWRFGRRWTDGDGTVLRDSPTAARLAGAAPALLESFDLTGSRALTLVRVAREVARERVDLSSPDHEHGWRRLRAIPGIGPWTVEMLALYGQGRHDQVPAGDVGLMKLVGRLRSGGDPHARASESEVRGFFEPYGGWAGLAAAHLIAVD